MKDMMPIFTTRKPLTTPTKAAVTIPASAAALAGHPWSIDSQADERADEAGEKSDREIEFTVDGGEQRAAKGAMAKSSVTRASS
jgi:hypothetical protein